MDPRLALLTTRTNRSLLDSALQARGPGESIRFWEERSRFSEERWPLWRVYAEVSMGSPLYGTLVRSRNSKEVSRAEFDERVGRIAAERIWHGKGSPIRGTGQPSLVILAGTPLAGKSTLTREIVLRAAEPVVHIENDEVRKVLFREPRFTVSEHRQTHNVSWELIRLGLGDGCHVLFDATNVEDRGREGAYEAAWEAGATPFVLFVSASEAALEARHASAPPSQRRAYERLGHKLPDSRSCSVSFATVESDQGVDRMVDRLTQVDFPIPFRR
jgi:predicted kinase